ncbi:hypothetical protein AGR8A_pAt20007 [Agrobacterium fabrum str. J-07]|nr:hypothetical protein AGR8A_pAt20007 [Agrobacterium fabrum str. J-07]
MLEQEKPSRPDTEHDQRIPTKTISNPSLSGTGAIFAHSQSDDVTNNARIEIARQRVMGGMVPAPNSHKGWE